MRNFFEKKSVYIPLLETFLFICRVGEAQRNPPFII